MKHTCRQVGTKVNENVIADSFSVIPTCSESFFQPWLIRRGEKERFWTSQNDKDGDFQVKIKHFISVMYRLKSNSFVFCLILSLLSLLFIPSFVYSEHITASGCSVSNVGYLSDLAKEYEKRTGIKVLARGGGSVLGLEELTEGKWI
jgi:hypothetical protein